MALDIISLSLAKAYTNNYVAESLEGAGALKGDPGKSAYEIDVSNGFTGTEVEWLESLKGEKGDDGQDGIYVTSMNISEDNKVTALLSNGNTLQVGTLNTVKGDKGDSGAVPRIDDETKRWFIGDYDTGYVAVPNTDISFNDLTDIPVIPTSLSQLVNDEEFIKNTVSNLLNYYTKSETYTKTEVTNLVSNISQLNTSIVSELPTENISTTTIYLISAGESIYNQYMYIDGEWANLGNTSMNLNGYVTSSEFNLGLDEKSDINHTHIELHTHSNKASLDTITMEMIQSWNSRFSGNYNDLTNKPNIPIVTNDLTDDLKETYDSAAEKSHVHNGNIPVLDKFSEDANGNPLYNNNPIGGKGGGSGTVKSVNGIFPASNSDGDVELSANDLDTYTKVEIETKIGNVLNIQYINSPLDSLVVKSRKEIYSKNWYPIFEKNMVIYEDDISIKFITTVAESSILNRIYIRTMNKDTHSYTDENTGNTYSTATNNSGYSLIFADKTYCYFSKTSSTSNGTIPVNFYRLNYTISGSTMEARANFPKVFFGTRYVKANNVVYGFGGATNWSLTDIWNSIWKYTIDSNTWTILPATIPHINALGYPILHENKVYSSGGYSNNSPSVWSQKYAWCFDIDTETMTQLPDRAVDAMSGSGYVINMGYVFMATVRNSNNVYTWGDLGSQIYIPEINEWAAFNSGLPFNTGTASNTNSNSLVLFYGVDNNTIHLTVDGESYYLSLNFKTLGLFSKNESVYITSYTKADKDVEDVNGNTIVAETPILANTEIKILEDETRLLLMTSIVTDGSWVRRPPTKILGMAEETILFEGNIGNNNNSEVINVINLLDSIENYDKIGVFFTSVLPSSLTEYHQYEEVYTTSILSGMSSQDDICIPFLFNDGEHVCVSSIQVNLSTRNQFSVLQSASFITKIIGIKYKTTVPEDEE